MLPDTLIPLKAAAPLLRLSVAQLWNFVQVHDCPKERLPPPVVRATGRDPIWGVRPGAVAAWLIHYRASARRFKEAAAAPAAIPSERQRRYLAARLPALLALAPAPAALPAPAPAPDPSTGMACHALPSPACRALPAACRALPTLEAILARDPAALAALDTLATNPRLPDRAHYCALACRAIARGLI